MIIVDIDWLSFIWTNRNVVIIDARGIMTYRFGHIKNSIPLSIDQVISIADNGVKFGYRINNQLKGFQ